MSDEMQKQDVLRVQGIMEKGYGIIPKAVMLDIRLTIEANAIYSYFRSFAGAGSTAFPSRDKILHDLQIGENRYYKHFKLLTKYGYISVKKNTDSTGKFTNNIYTLIETIEPHLQNNAMANPYPQNEGAVYPRLQNPCMENEGTNINSIKNNILNNNILDSSQGQSQNQSHVQSQKAHETYDEKKSIVSKDIRMPKLKQKISGGFRSLVS